MAEEMKGTNISSPLVPFTKDDKYATHDETFGRGGYRSVSSIAEMNAIPAERRKEGMLVNVQNDKIYKWVGNSFVPAFKTINGQSVVGPGNLTISGGGGGTSTPNLKLSIRKFKDDVNNVIKLQFKFYEHVPDGYICFLRRKRNTGASWNSPRGYRVPYLSFVNNSTPYGMGAGSRDFTLSTAEYEANVWHDLPFQRNFGEFFESGTYSSYKYKRFTGNIYRNTLFYENSGNYPLIGKNTVRLDCGLQYIQFDPNYLQGLKVGGKIPQAFLNAGEMQRFCLYLRGGSTFAYSHSINIAIK